jgi:hypothetical protein
MDIYKTFNNLRYHHENEVVEFKKAENSFSFDDLGKYFSALSNEANLRDKDFAWLIFGGRQGDSYDTAYELVRGAFEAEHPHNMVDATMRTC